MKSPFSILAQCMLDTPSDHPEAREIREKAERYLACSGADKFATCGHARADHVGAHCACPDRSRRKFLPSRGA